MVSLYKVNDVVNISSVELIGLSTDNKPFDVFEGKALTNGSKFYEMDTGNTYYYDVENKNWYGANGGLEIAPKQFAGIPFSYVKRGKKWLDQAETNPDYITISCNNLKPNHKYKLLMFVKSTTKKCRANDWMHPSNTFSLEKGKMSFGYARIEAMQSSYGESEPKPCPIWMPRKGVLQSEWDFIPESNKVDISINFPTWILDGLKYNAKGEWCNLACTPQGETENHGNKYTDFRFCIYDEETNSLYKCDNTMRIRNGNTAGEDGLALVVQIV